MIQKRSLGKTGVEVSCVGLGGEGVLRTFGKQTQAHAVFPGLKQKTNSRYKPDIKADSFQDTFLLT